MAQKKCLLLAVTQYEFMYDETMRSGHICSSRAMSSFGAGRLLRSSRSVFLAPQCAALRCPWMSALVLPVVLVPTCARGPPRVFVYCTCTKNLCCSAVGRKKTTTTTNEPRPIFHLTYRIRMLEVDYICPIVLNKIYVTTSVDLEVPVVGDALLLPR
jgi:hypothetical protein